jgi:hypothetical protein
MIISKETPKKQQELPLKSDEKRMLVKAVIDKITPLGQKYGKFSWRVECNNKNYYFNAKADIIDRLLKQGELCAFLYTPQPTKDGSKVYDIIDQVIWII